MSENTVVCALYTFAVLNDFRTLRQPLLDRMQGNGVRGTLLLAREGINGTIAGPRDGIDAVKAWLADDGRFDGIDYKAKLRLYVSCITAFVVFYGYVRICDCF